MKRALVWLLLQVQIRAVETSTKDEFLAGERRWEPSPRDLAQVWRLAGRRVAGDELKFVANATWGCFRLPAALVTEIARRLVR